jgi:hypothetical protein
MTRTALCGAILSAAMAVGVSAQTPPQATGQADKQSMKAGTITVTGCLAADTSSGAAAPTGGATGTSGAKSEGYILKNASSSPSGAAPAAAGATASEYVLTGGNKSELKKFENSKVEIRGKVDEAKSPAGAAAGAASGADKPKLHIDSVKQISPSCSN